MNVQKDLYREEAYELLAVLEDSLLELEHNPADREVVSRVFRALHTIKGSGAMFGFNDIAAFTHTIETVYDMVREGALNVTQELISLTLGACDRIKAMLDGSGGGEDAAPVRTQELQKAFRKFLSTEEDAVETVPDKEQRTDDRESAGRAITTYRIRFRPHHDLFANGTNPIPLIREIKSLGECSVVCLLDDLPDLGDLDPESCYAAWDIVLTTSRDANAIRDIFLFVEDLSEIAIEMIDTSTDCDREYKKVGEILVEKGDLAKQELDDTLKSRKLIGEVLMDAGKITDSDLTSALY